MLRDRNWFDTMGVFSSSFLWLRCTKPSLFYGCVVRNRRFPARFFGSWCTRLNAQWSIMLCISWPDFFPSAFFAVDLRFVYRAADGRRLFFLLFPDFGLVRHVLNPFRKCTLLQYSTHHYTTTLVTLWGTNYLELGCVQFPKRERVCMMGGGG